MELDPKLLLKFQLYARLRINGVVEKKLLDVLLSAVNSYGFKTAELTLSRDAYSPVTWRVTSQGTIRKYRKRQGRPAPEGGVTFSATLPSGSWTREPLGTFEVAVNGADARAANGQLDHAVLLAQRLVDLLQEHVLLTKSSSSVLGRLGRWLEIVNTVNSSLDIKKVLHVVCQITADLLDARCCILFIDQSTQTLVPGAAVMSYDPELRWRFKEVKGYPVFPVVWQAIKTERPCVLTPENIDQWMPARVVADFQLGWVVVAPMLKYHRVIGVMHVDRPAGTYGFTPAEVEIIFALAREAATAVENARLVEDLYQARHDLERFIGKVITAQEDERRRIANDLHDGLVQALLGIWFRLQELIGKTEPGEAAHQLAQATRDLGLQIQEIRRIIYNLRPVALDDHGLVAAVQVYLEKYYAETGIKAHLEVTGRPRRLPTAVEISFYRILQEAAANAYKHARCRQLTINIDFQENELVMTIKDDGIGLSNTKPNLGLISIQERIRVLGGTMEIASPPGYGTALTVIAPVGTLANEKVS